MLVLKNIIFLSLWLGTVNLFANDSHKFLIFGHTGFTKDFSPPYFSTNWERGLNMCIGMGKKVSKNIVLQGTAEYHLFKNTSDVISNGDGTVYSFLLNLKKNVPNKPKSSFIPFYKAGVGLLQLNSVAVYSTTKNDNTQNSKTLMIEDEKHRSVFSAAAGIGFDTVINEDTMMNIEIMAVVGFDKPEIITIVPLKLGVSVSF